MSASPVRRDSRGFTHLPQFLLPSVCSYLDVFELCVLSSVNGATQRSMRTESTAVSCWTHVPIISVSHKHQVPEPLRSSKKQRGARGSQPRPVPLQTTPPCDFLVEQILVQEKKRDLVHQPRQ